MFLNFCGSISRCRCSCFVLFLCILFGTKADLVRKSEYSDTPRLPWAGDTCLRGGRTKLHMATRPRHSNKSCFFFDKWDVRFSINSPIRNTCCCRMLLAIVLTFEHFFCQVFLPILSVIPSWEAYVGATSCGEMKLRRQARSRHYLFKSLFSWDQLFSDQIRFF